MTSGQRPDGLKINRNSKRLLSLLGEPKAAGIAGGGLLKCNTRIRNPGLDDYLVRMTTIAELLAQKKKLLERLEADPQENEREEIERLLEKINAALNLLDDADWADSQK
jgi:hypothetical protein